MLSSAWLHSLRHDQTCRRGKDPSGASRGWVESSGASRGWVASTGHSQPPATLCPGPSQAPHRGSPLFWLPPERWMVVHAELSQRPGVVINTSTPPPSPAKMVQTSEWLWLKTMKAEALPLTWDPS